MRSHRIPFQSLGSSQSSLAAPTLENSLPAKAFLANQPFSGEGEEWFLVVTRLRLVPIRL